MNVVSRIMRRFRKGRGGANPSPQEGKTPLREFVYLDEVSLRSLLSSQTGEVTEGTSNQIVDTLGAEAGTRIGAGAPLVGTAEATSRFQTSNSSTLQTSRKATVQSWFREFHNIQGLRLMEIRHEVPKLNLVTELKKPEATAIALNSSRLTRGSLIELRVKLAADPVFHLATLASEFVGMAADFPDKFNEPNVIAALKEMQPVNKILDRLLAGLIPIRADAVDYTVVEADGEYYVAHRQAISDLGLEEHTLGIVGVTEHIAYWKDIRRVLFSDAEFTILCRIARSGLQPTWTPVKLADLFRGVAPDLVEKINAAGRLTLAGARQKPFVMSEENRLWKALRSYQDMLLAESHKTLTPEQEVHATREIARQQAYATSASGQRSAFAAVKSLLSELSGLEVDTARDLELRNMARASSKLPLLPSQAKETEPISPIPVDADSDTKARLLDVEIVAIYW